MTPIEWVGWLGNACFASRVLVQWLHVEQARARAAPRIFWLLSLAGSVLLGAYAVEREVWVLLGTFQAGPKFPWAYPMAIIAAAGVILTAGYILWLLRRVYLGKEREEYIGYPDASKRETFILVPMAVLCIAMGVFPMQTVFNFTNGTLDLMLEKVTSAIAMLS